MALVHPGRDRHEFDMADAEAADMGEYGWLAERLQRAADAVRHGRVAHREGLHREFVDEGGCLLPPHRKRGEGFTDDAARHEIGRIDASLRQPRVPAERAVDPGRIGIDEQLRRVEPVAALRLPGALGPQRIAQAGAGAWQQAVMNVAAAAGQGQACDFGLARLVEEAEVDPFAMAGEDREGDARLAGHRAEAGGQRAGDQRRPRHPPQPPAVTSGEVGTCQIRSAYSRMARSALNQPQWAVLVTDMRHHLPWSAQSESMRRWAWR
ncbi:hypothetical protein ABIE41_002594 [Bosea sp. OAE506]